MMMVRRLGKMGRELMAAAVREGGAEARRCFSMGSISYVMKEDSLLKVAISSHGNKRDLKKRGLGHYSRREFNGFDAFKVVGAQSGGNGNGNGNGDGGSLCKRESFSLSKIWLREKGGDAAMDDTRRAFSFRWLSHRSAAVEGGADAENGGGGGVDFDEEIGMQRD
ncbi:hypothetical protein SASPL_125788 [Salvia splendens]|uniref:Uncharacterized protein n=1 Tax=Salvia splendens TaxID=180675 RepID=A0A8X8XJK0_SALSN|nr:hypothetical protein SASPL_125788 [Salvia splendens]